ncbi:MAG: hypothetical protein IJC76_08705 [Lachnospiraceae bacterium]|nr:hypothetical protein [Lachnospiraceae bacterium]
MKRMFKIIVAILLIVMGNMVYIHDITCDVYADVHIEKEEPVNKNIFVKKHKKYKNVTKTIQREVNKHSTVAKKEVEKYLNEQGVFDDEIAGLYTDEDLRDLKIDDLYNTDVYVSYYAIVDKEELTGCVVEEEEMLELTDEQVDKVMESIGLKPIETYAAITEYDAVGGMDDKETPSM